MSDVTRLIDAAAGGDRQAAADLLPLVYEELRKLAAVRMAAETAGHTLDATALVHEAYLRLVAPDVAPQWNGRGHFFAAAAESMRRILVDRARRKRATKHGGEMTRRELVPEVGAAPDRSDDLLALDEVLDRFAAAAPRAAEVVKLRYFAGLTIPQVASVLGLSTTTVNGDIAYARAWLKAALSDADPRA